MFHFLSNVLEKLLSFSLFSILKLVLGVNLSGTLNYFRKKISDFLLVLNMSLFYNVHRWYCWNTNLQEKRKYSLNKIYQFMSFLTVKSTIYKWFWMIIKKFVRLGHISDIALPHLMSQVSDVTAIYIHPLPCSLCRYSNRCCSFFWLETWCISIKGVSSFIFLQWKAVILLALSPNILASQ